MGRQAWGWRRWWGRFSWEREREKNESGLVCLVGSDNELLSVEGEEEEEEEEEGWGHFRPTLSHRNRQMKTAPLNKVPRWHFRALAALWSSVCVLCVFVVVRGRGRNVHLQEDTHARAWACGWCNTHSCHAVHFTGWQPGVWQQANKYNTAWRQRLQGM